MLKRVAGNKWAAIDSVTDLKLPAGFRLPPGLDLPPGFLSTSKLNGFQTPATITPCSSWTMRSWTNSDFSSSGEEDGDVSMPLGSMPLGSMPLGTFSLPVERKTSATAFSTLSQPLSRPSSDVEETTVMMRYIPNDYTRDMLLGLLVDEGFSGSFDFAYLPIDFNTGCGLGYAFINCCSLEEALRFRRHFHGFSNWSVPSGKVCDTTLSGSHHGVAAHIERYRNSSVMHKSVADEYKPALFVNGQRVPFPPPTKKIWQPKIGSKRCQDK